MEGLGVEIDCTCVGGNCMPWLVSKFPGRHRVKEHVLLEGGKVELPVTPQASRRPSLAAPRPRVEERAWTDMARGARVLQLRVDEHVLAERTGIRRHVFCCIEARVEEHRPEGRQREVALRVEEHLRDET